MVGAEKLTDRVAAAFEENFGIRPLEGYGCTECSPVVAVNARDFRAAGFSSSRRQARAIGHPLPGISVRIVDPETSEPLPRGRSGLLLVQGTERHAGLPWTGRTRRPRCSETAGMLPATWRCWTTDGFLQITDRLSRFSKIGGEMVPHLKVEEALYQLLGGTDSSGCGWSTG